MTNSLLVRYSLALETRPILTKSATSGVLNGLQEIIASLATGTFNEKTLGKTATMSVYGSCFSAPLGHFLYQSLERLFQGRSGRLAGVGKLMYSNLVISPILTYWYLVALAYSSGQSLKKSIALARSKLLATMKMAWMINPTVQIYAFQRLDPKFWLPFFNFAAFLVFNLNLVWDYPKHSIQNSFKEINCTLTLRNPDSLVSQYQIPMTLKTLHSKI